MKRKENIEGRKRESKRRRCTGGMVIKRAKEKQKDRGGEKEGNIGVLVKVVSYYEGL